MALTDGNVSDLIMPVAPMYGGNGSGGFGNSSSGDWAWIILLLLLGWGGNRGWGGSGGGFGGGSDLYPWMNQAEITSDGFRDQMLNNNVTSIRDSIGNLSTQLCNCCSDVQMSLATGFAGVEQGANARAMASMNQLFGLSQQFADCCCENRLANCQTQNIIQSEASATRFADANNTRDIVDSQTRGTQIILDKLCQLELDGKQDRINDLERQLTMANLAASQVRQTSDIQTSIINELRACPIPAQPVYGSQPIFTCNNGCGCGGNNGCGCGSF